jgi:hypothetical protein
MLRLAGIVGPLALLATLWPNFSCLEDRETGEIVVLVPHYYPSGRWMSGELCRYRVQVPRIGG